MLAQQAMRLIGEEEYLELEKTSEIRHEYVDGYIYSMTGGTRQHNKISGNIYAALRQEINGTSCVERYHRLDETGLWHLTVYEKGDSVQFSCIEYQLGMDEIYAGVLYG